MRATSVLQKVLGPTLHTLHAFQCRGLLLAVEALVAGRRLTLMDLARSFPGAERVRAPLKRLDRLLSNERLHGQRLRVYGGMAQWLLSRPDPLLLVDWSDLKTDGRWCVLRAGVALKGRSVPLLDLVVPVRQLGNDRVQRRFLAKLWALVPRTVRPIVISDAGFRGNWYAALDELGWRWIGRVRGRVLVRDSDRSQWQLASWLHGRVKDSARHLGCFVLGRQRRQPCRLVLGGRRRRTGRQSLTRSGRPSADRRHLKAAQSHREVWLLACSRALGDWPASRILAAYRRRMQIEESFRDLKSHQYGYGFEDSQTRLRVRLEMLLLIQALAVLAVLLIGHIGQALGLAWLLQPNSCRRRSYSLWRTGQELAARGWITPAQIHLARLIPPGPDDADIRARVP